MAGIVVFPALVCELIAGALSGSVNDKESGEGFNLQIP